MSIRTLAAAAALAATAGSADAQVIYSGGGVYGTAPGFYGAGFGTPYYSNYSTRGVIYAGSPVTPLYNSGLYTNTGLYTSPLYTPLYNSGLYTSYPYGTSLYTSYPYTSFYNRGYGTGLYGTGYTGLYNSGIYTPGYVRGYNTVSGSYLPRAGLSGGFRMRR